jgi:MoaA/NifB/PqqE/SkfB family radical SAM enzyme
MNFKSALKHLVFFKKKPLVFIGMAKGFFRSIVLRKNVLRTVDLAVTYNCHYKCEYCSAFLLKKEGKEVLTVDQIKKIWEQAQSLGAIHVNLTGGEPLMRNIDELCQIIKNFHPERTLVSMVTNSVLVTKEKLKRLKDAGLDTLQLSMESLDPETNDKIRGVKGVTQKTMDAFRFAKELDLNVCLSAVACHDNQQELKKLLEFAKKENVFLLLNTASSVGKWQGKNEAKMIDKDVALFEEFMSDSNARSDTSFNFSGKSGCPAGKERIHITAYGDVITCPLVQVSYGNVLQEPLKDIFERMNSMPFIKKYSKLCKHSFDSEYYQQICLPAEQIKNPPLSIYSHPNIKNINSEDNI